MAAARMTMAVSSSCFAGAAPRSDAVAAKNVVCRLSMAGPASTLKTAMEVASISVSASRVARVAVVARVSELGQSVVEQEALDAPEAAPSAGSKLYVGNLPWTCDSQQLAEVFQDAGNVELVEVIYDRETSRSRGFAFVTMATPEDALAAIEKLDGLEFGGRALKVNFPQSNKEPRFNNFNERPARREREYGNRQESGGSSFNSENKLFVGNLSWGVDDVSLQQLFSDYGRVVDAKVVYDRDSGKSRGFGFVTFSQSSEVNEAVSNLDGAEFDGRQLRVNPAGDKPPPRAY